ncbi:MAG TPA: lysophospholipid acyltransferase family protein [Polyangiaceae bacterium]|nr:lysophospholipid acyltransferase family protein [Polyangiaceae bacterium]
MTGPDARPDAPRGPAAGAPHAAPPPGAPSAAGAPRASGAPAAAAAPLDAAHVPGAADAPLGASPAPGADAPRAAPRPPEPPPAGRATGPIAGALRVARLLGVTGRGLASIELAHRRRGPEGARKAFARAAAGLCDVFGLEVRVEGELPARPEVRVANHVSYLDILALASADAGRFLSRHDVADWPVVGRVARRCGTLFVDRDSTSARAVALRALATAARRAPAVLVFPEGGTAAGPLRPFQPGAFLVARQAKVPVRPLALAYDAPAEVAWADGEGLPAAAWRRLCGPRVRLSIHALEPVEARGAPLGELAERCRGAIDAALGGGETPGPGGRARGA